MESTVEVQQLVDQQVALRRVAELAAQDVPAERILDAVVVQASRLSAVEFVMLLRYGPDGSSEIMAVRGAPPVFQVGMHASAQGEGASHRVWRARGPVRIDDLHAASGRWPEMAREHGFSTSAGVPVFIEGALWGVLVACARGDPLPVALIAQLTDFAELTGTAVAAAQARGRLRELADEQTALRRVAELVARGVPLPEVFAAVAAETSRLLGAGTALLPRDQQPDSDAVGGAPVVVEGRAWGTLTTRATGAEDRLRPFAELAAVAIANAENKDKLTASRARVVATADETRRRVQRDVHDGAQQRLVHTIAALKMARDELRSGGDAAGLVDEALANAELALRDLRDVVRGILPADLTHGGLGAGIRSLVRDLPVPVDVDLTAPRLPVAVETTAYFVVVEALTNVVKHAQAGRVRVGVAVEAGSLVVEVRDDGVGGADAARGTGLTGLLDRVEAGDGSLVVTSVAGRGTVLRAVLPLGRR